MGEGGHRVRPTDPELEELRRAVGSRRDDLIGWLGGYVGFRTFEIPQVRPKQVKRTEYGERDRLRIPEARDTTGSGGKPRDAYLPEPVEAGVHRHVTSEEVGWSDPIALHTAGTPLRIDTVLPVGVAPSGS